jgi:ABC-type uncharacterized transport system permease subunit
VGLGLLSVVAFWGWNELADRIRSGDVAADLLRPVPPVTSYLAADLGRAAAGLRGASLTAVEADGHRLSYSLDSVSAGAAVAALLAVASVRDLSLVEPDIEDVVARLYTSVSDAP